MAVRIVINYILAEYDILHYQSLFLGWLDGRMITESFRKAQDN